MTYTINWRHKMRRRQNTDSLNLGQGLATKSREETRLAIPVNVTLSTEGDQTLVSIPPITPRGILPVSRQP